MSAAQADLSAKVGQLKRDFPNFSTKFIKTVLAQQKHEVAHARLFLAVAKKKADEEKSLEATLGLHGGSNFESPFALSAQPKDRGFGAHSATQPPRIPELPARTNNVLDSDLNTSVESYLSEKSESFYSSQSSVGSSDLKRSTSLLSTSMQRKERTIPILPPKEIRDAPNNKISPFATARPLKPTFGTFAPQDKHSPTIVDLFNRQKEPKQKQDDKRAKRKRSLELSDEEPGDAKPDFFDDIEEIFSPNGSEPATKRKKLVIETEPTGHRLSRPVSKKPTKSIEVSDRRLESAPHSTRSASRITHGLAPVVHGAQAYAKESPKSKTIGPNDSIEVVDIDEFDGSATIGNDSNLSESPSSSTAISDPLDSHFCSETNVAPFVLCSQEPNGRPMAKAARRRIIEDSD